MNQLLNNSHFGKIRLYSTRGNRDWIKRNPRLWSCIKVEYFDYLVDRTHIYFSIHVNILLVGRIMTRMILCKYIMANNLLVPQVCVCDVILGFSGASRKCVWRNLRKASNLNFWLSCEILYCIQGPAHTVKLTIRLRQLIQSGWLIWPGKWQKKGRKVLHLMALFLEWAKKL